MKLNIGCGNKRKEGFLGVDKFMCEAVDVLADLSHGIPFGESSVDAIWLDNLIEHIADIPEFMQEIHRVGRDEAVVTIFTPHFASASSWRDPTHVHHLSYFSMDHFEKESVAHYMGGGFKVIERRLSFGGGLGLIGRLIFKLSPQAYETKWCFIFRPSTIKYVLKVRKI